MYHSTLGLRKTKKKKKIQYYPATAGTMRMAMKELDAKTDTVRETVCFR